MPAAGAARAAGRTAVAMAASAELLADLSPQRLAVALVRVVPAAQRQLAALLGDEAQRHALVEQLDQLGANRVADLGRRLAAGKLGRQVLEQLRLQAGGVALEALLVRAVQFAVSRPGLGLVAPAAAPGLHAGLQRVALGLRDRAVGDRAVERALLDALQRVVQLRALDAEPLGQAVEGQGQRAEAHAAVPVPVAVSPAPPTAAAAVLIAALRGIARRERSLRRRLTLR